MSEPLEAEPTIAGASPAQDIEVRVQPRRPRPAPAPPAAEPTVAARAPSREIELQVQPRRRPVPDQEGVEPRPVTAAPVPPRQAGPPSGAVRVRVTGQPPAAGPGLRAQAEQMGIRRRRKPGAIVVVLGALVWFGLLLATFDISPVLVGVVVTPVLCIAVFSAWRSVTRLADVGAGSGGDREGFGVPTPVALAGLGGLGITPIVAGIGGPIVMIVWLAISTAAVVQPYVNRPGGALRRAALASALPALGAGCLVLAVGQGPEIGMVLIAGYCLFDVANASMGTGRTGGVVGAVSGFVTLMVLAVIVQSLLAPPFTGRTPWVLCVMIGILAPLGVWFCSRLAPGRLPALRRLDSLVFAAPVWVLGISILLHR